MSDDQVPDLLKRALAVLDAANVPDDLRQVAFTAAVGLLAEGSLDASGRASSQNPTPPLGGDGKSSATGVPLLDAIAKGLEMKGEIIKRLFSVEEDGRPRLIIKTSRLPKTDAAAARDIALLTMAARQLGGMDDYTDADVLRDTVKRFGRLQEKHFGDHMRSLDNLVQDSGKGRNIRRKLTQPGIEEAAELAKKYTTTEDSA